MHPDLRERLVRDTVVSHHDVLRHHTPHQLRALVTRGELVRVWRGVYSDDGPTPSLTTRLRGLDLALGEPVVACSHTAAELLGFAVDRSALVHVVAPVPRALADRPGLRVHRGVAGPVTVVAGRPVVDAAWTAVDVARSRSRPRALATLDAALRTGRCTRSELTAVLGHWRGCRGMTALRPLVDLADGLAESPMESETRLLLHDEGLPAPVLQHEVSDPAGRVIARLDLAWPEQRVAVEFDGVEFHADRAALARDRRRGAGLLAAGWRCLSLISADVRRDGARTAAVVRGLLTADAAWSSAGVS